MDMMRKKRKNSGFSLLELLVVVLIIAVVAAMAYASRTSNKSIVNASAKEVYGFFIDAKIAAIKAGHSAIIKTAGKDKLRAYIDANANKAGDDVFVSAHTRLKPSADDYDDFGVLTNVDDEFDELYSEIRFPHGVLISEDFPAVYFDARGVLRSLGTESIVTSRVILCPENPSSLGNCDGNVARVAINVNMAGVAKINYNYTN